MLPCIYSELCHIPIHSQNHNSKHKL